MHSIISSTLIGASIFSGVFAAPALDVSSYNTVINNDAAIKPLNKDGSIFPLGDGFPNPNSQQLIDIEKIAHGTLPNGKPGPPLSSEGITNIQLVAFNELFEVAFFSDLLFNITTNVPGFEIPDSDNRKFIIESLEAVLAQEELHALNAEKGLIGNGQQPILPCKYKFPTTNFEDAIELAATFTDLVLGTLQDVIQIFAENNDAAATRGVASVIGQEGEQEAFYRLLQNKNKIPSELPFLTTSTRDFAFSALQGFVVPGSCPNENLINLKIFGVLNLLTKNIRPVDQNLQFSFDIRTLNQSSLFSYDNSNSYSHGSSASSYHATSTSSSYGYRPTGSYESGKPNHAKRDGSSLSSYSGYSVSDWEKLSLVYINQQNTPIVEKLQNVKIDGTIVTFEAFFPFVENFLNGFTIAAVTSNAGPFETADQVADNTLFAPAPIEVN